MANSADPDQLAPTDLDLHCLKRQGISGLSRINSLMFYTRTDAAGCQQPFCCCQPTINSHCPPWWLLTVRWRKKTSSYPELLKCAGCLMLSTLGKTLPLSGIIQQTTYWNIFLFLFFFWKQFLTFHANCLQWRQLAWKVWSCFLGKIRKVSSICHLLN